MAARNSTVVARAPLAVVGKTYLVVEYKRDLAGLPRWKRRVFRVFRRVARFLDARLGIPVIVHHDREGDFRVDYCGVFSDRALAIAAIEKMRATQNSGHFGWQELDLNAVAPSHSDRYHDGDFPAARSMQMRRANKVVTCPYNHSQRNPDETIARGKLVEIHRLAAELVAASAMKPAANLKVKVQ